ncbi:phosphatidylglycerol lysyltransferase domain-containing protein [Streptomyces sp. H10-C2]|uniref:phosphatidylglycerol lysyltransferase domain-containing protein n=1 Tax=unclassified Streptomyces TaxID=2593676 RepID=UPI0024BA69EA|nr:MULTISPECIES: phosphatidylglycerol lysyltransferase domain-containing protein [unclassified Streptomyces]MDJ0339998.1 phosphatidylglycerol lysyltransferase domain-containing protein [Streptomyces sp. PH10-H1]MDJ0369365.1 phosphatidylglycerol lysyltransferase domain-containing protein [Streptomyces sp. H10-C2]
MRQPLAMTGPMDWSLTSGAVPWIVLAAGLVSLGWLLVVRRRSWWTLTVPLIALGTAVAVFVVQYLEDNSWRLIADELPLNVLVWIGIGLFGVALAVARCFYAGRWRVRLAALLAGLLVLLAACSEVNRVYDQYPRLRTLVTALTRRSTDLKTAAGGGKETTAVRTPAGGTLESAWKPPPGMPDKGSLSKVRIPGTVSGFSARDAWVYLPPAYRTSPRALLPVIVLMPGQPGSPQDWLDSGQLADTMDAYAARHHGLAPVAVSVDTLGSPLNNTICADTKRGKVHTYLTQDVPAWIKANLQVAGAPTSWAAGGYSLGGTCSLQLAVTAPALFGSFIDISGQREPTLGDHRRTVNELFGGSTAAYGAISPLKIMQTRPFPATNGLFISPDALGPLATFRDRLVTSHPGANEIRDACAASVKDCHQIHAEERFYHSPAILMTVMPALLLLVLAEGLRRGRRLAWTLAIVINLALMAIVLYELLDFLGSLDLSTPEGRSDRNWVIRACVEQLLLPAASVVLLLVTRARFQLKLPRATVRRVTAVVGGSVLAAGAAYVGVGYAIRGQFFPGATFPSLCRGLLSVFLPPINSNLASQGPIPVGSGANWLYEYCGLVPWLIGLIVLLVVFRGTRLRVSDEQAEQARAILTAHGGSTLSYLSTWEGNHYWTSPAGHAGVAYRVLSTIALTTGDPFGEPSARPRAVAEFGAFCDARGWTPCLYSVTEESRRAAEALGWKSLQVAEETVVPLAELEFKGKKWQDVRTALNKVGKAGITAEWWHFPDAPLALTEQIRSISEEWVADKGLPEMGFTLGGLDELDDPEVRCLIAVDADRTIRGITSWMPVYRDGKPVGWTLDFMRRRSAGFRGVMEFLIASVALGLKEEGAEFISLSGAPMARMDRGEAPDPLQRLVDMSGRLLEPVYGFRSLLAFKAKFQPEYHPMYMCYPDPAALPTITRAIGKAYLPHLTAAQGVRLVRQLSGS